MCTFHIEADYSLTQIKLNQNAKERSEHITVMSCIYIHVIKRSSYLLTKTEMTVKLFQNTILESDLVYKLWKWNKQYQYNEIIVIMGYCYVANHRIFGLTIIKIIASGMLHNLWHCLQYLSKIIFFFYIICSVTHSGSDDVQYILLNSNPLQLQLWLRYH